MPNLRGRLTARKSPSSELDLFSWSPTILHTSPTRAARKLAARYGWSLAHASTIALLAGLGNNGDAR